MVNPNSPKTGKFHEKLDRHRLLPGSSSVKGDSEMIRANAGNEKGSL
jgi:hypothetical protein